MLPPKEAMVSSATLLRRDRRLPPVLDLHTLNKFNTLEHFWMVMLQSTLPPSSPGRLVCAHTYPQHVFPYIDSPTASLLPKLSCCPPGL